MGKELGTRGPSSRYRAPWSRHPGPDSAHAGGGSRLQAKVSPSSQFPRVPPSPSSSLLPRQAGGCTESCPALAPSSQGLPCSTQPRAQEAAHLLPLVLLGLLASGEGQGRRAEGTGQEEMGWLGEVGVSRLHRGQGKGQGVLWPEAIAGAHSECRHREGTS